MADPLGDPIRYEGYSLAEKYAWAQGGMGPAATEPAAKGLHTLSSVFDDSANDMRKALEGIGVSWRGQAATATSDALRQAAESTSAAGQSSRSGGNQIEAVGQSWATTKTKISQPVEVGSRNFKDWATDVFDAAFGGVFDVQSDYRKRLHAYQAADATANDALREHEQNVRAANTAFPDVATRPLPASAPVDPGPAIPPSPNNGVPGDQPEPGAPRPLPPGGSAPDGSPGTLPQHNAPAPNGPSSPPAPTGPVPGYPAPNEWRPLDPDGWYTPGWIPGTPPPGGRPRPPGRTGPLGGPGEGPTGTPGQPTTPRPAPTGPSPDTGVPAPSPRPSSPAPGMPGGSGGSGQGGPGGPGSGGQPQSPGDSEPGGLGPIPPGAAPGGAAGGRPRGSGSRPGRSEGSGYDWGDIGVAVGVPVVTALTAGGVYATVQHHRKHGVNKTLRHSTLQARVNHVKRQARQAAEQAEQREGGKDRPGLAYEWAKHVLARDENGQQIHGRYAFNVGGKGEIPQWLNPCSAPGIGFTGPGAHDALRCCVLTILLRTGRRPAGRVIIPAADATTLLGSAQPDTVPEGLRIVEDLDHALAALENEVTQRRKATREQLEQLPLVVLVLAETPATRDRAEDLADLLHAARWLGVSALIGATWTEGASLDIDERSVVTGTRGHPVNHLHNAYLFHLPARHLRNAYPDIDNANAAADYRHGPTSGGLNTPDPETTSAETTATEVTGTEAGAEGAAATTTEPTVADPNELDPDHHPDGGPAAEPDRESEAPTTGTAGAAAASPEGTGSSVARILKPPDGPKAGAADREQIPTTTQASEHHATTTDDAPLAHAAKAAQDDKDAARVAVAAEASRPVVRLEILNTPRMTVMPAATSDDPDPTPINVTPGARARTQTQVWINMALNREGRRRAVIAAELFPDTPIDRPATNTLNTNMTRLRQLIQDKTGGAVADLVHITEEGTCRLADVVEVDYWEFQDAMAPHNGMSTPERARAFQHALRGYRGQLAESVDADWITSYRDEMQSTVLKAAVDLAHDLSENHGDHDTAIAILDQAITWDPLAESIYQHVIGLLMNLSREDAAIQRYRALEIELDREFDGMKPQPETTRLIWP